MGGKLVVAAAVAALVAFPIAVLHAANAPAAPQAGGPTAQQLADFPELRITRYSQASLTDGRQVFRETCGSCHGSDARGGPGGSDLTSSKTVYDDTDGTQLAAFLKGAHAASGVSVGALSTAQLTDMANFLHAAVSVISDRNFLDNSILVGDPAAGARYFNGAGGCKTCHSPTGDLAGIGRLDPLTLQGQILFPPRAPAGGGRGAAAPAAPVSAEAAAAAQAAAAAAGAPAPAAAAGGRGGGGGGRGGAGAAPANGPVVINKDAVRATVTAPGQPPVTGQLVRKSPFEVVIADLQTGERKTWPIQNGQPKVTYTDPLEGHAKLRAAISDNELHNLTAYLASLK